MAKKATSSRTSTVRAESLGDSVLLLWLGDRIGKESAARVAAATRRLEEVGLAGVRDIVPAFCSVAVFFDPGQAPSPQVLLDALGDGAAASALAESPARVVEIPVVYGGEAGPDLESVAAHTGLSPSRVIELHSRGEYRVDAIGFSPGFPYLAGLPPQLATPRRATPRPRIPAGSVGIGGLQTGVYPLASPGGWNLIGRACVNLFDPARHDPALLRIGDQVRFRRVESSPASAAATSQETLASPFDATAIEVLRPGLLTTVQDLGRSGFRRHGVPAGGAVDALAASIANWIVGNDADAAVLEVTLVGPELRFRCDTVVAVCGAEFDGVPAWRPIAVSAGQVLNLGMARRGCRGYLAVAGGIDVPCVLGGRGTVLRAGFGGFAGRVLRPGDVVPVARGERSLRGQWSVDPHVIPGYADPGPLRVLPGAQAGEFDHDWTELPFTVSKQSDRMGLRLEGGPLKRSASRDLISAAVCPGTIQVPPDGLPIVLLADAQTIGGYPQIAHVAAVDWPRLAQLRPGDAIEFASISREEAIDQAARRASDLAKLRAGLLEKWR